MFLFITTFFLFSPCAVLLIKMLTRVVIVVTVNADKPKAVAIQDVFEVVREQAKQAQITLATQTIALPTDQVR